MIVKIPSLNDSVKDILTSLELVKLKNDINLPIQIEGIKAFSSIDDNTNSIIEFLGEQGFKSISQRLENNANVFSNVTREKQNKVEKNQYILINSKKNLEEIISNIKRKGYCAIDTETNSLNIEKVK